MKITINNREVEVQNNETLIEVARREGFHIPSLCYSKDAKHKSSCMACAVKNCTTGQVIPSCTTLPAEDMQIETDSPEIILTRTLSLELLLSDHRADCEAPCKTACPGNLDIALMNRLYDQGKWNEALDLLRDTLVIPATLCFICNAPCEKICRKGDINKPVPIREIKKELVAKTSLNKINKRDSGGKKIAIIGSDPAAISAAYHLIQRNYRVTVFEKSKEILIPYIENQRVPEDILSMELEIILKMGVEIISSVENFSLNSYDGVIASVHENPNPQWITPQTKTKQPARLVLEGHKMAERLDALLSSVKNPSKQDPKIFNSTFSRFTDCEKKNIEAQQSTFTGNNSGCLYCDCDEKNDCRLRQYATEYGIKNSRYVKNSISEALKRQRIGEKIWFEQAKCIRCGLCVYNSNNGFTFKDRGFVMQVMLPEENAGNINDELTKLCPTGALYVRK